MRTDAGRIVSHEEVLRGVLRKAAVGEATKRAGVPGAPRTDPLALEQAAALLAQGFTVREAERRLRAKGYKISKSTIDHLLGGGRQLPRATKEQRAVAVEARRAGEKIKDIAARLGMSKSQVADACESAGLTRKSRACQKRRMGLCREEGCLALATMARRCGKHYRATRKAKMPPCAVDGCGTPSHSRGLCAMHYAHQRKAAA